MSAARRSDAELLRRLPVAMHEWLQLERFQLHDAKIYQRAERDPSFDVKYFPQNGGVFQLPCAWVPRRCLYLFGNEPAGDAGLKFLADEDARRLVLLSMHPSAAAHYREFLQTVGASDGTLNGARILALATSSTRTLLAWPEDAPEQAVFIKTSLHSPVLGDRRVTRIKAGRSVSLSTLVQAELDELPATLRYLPESLAFVPRRAPWMGAIVRSVPRDIREGRVRVAPLFSLIGGDDEHVPLLLTMLERTGTPPLQFVHDVLCRRFAQLWLDLALDHGLLIEAHGQDLLLELSPDQVPTGRFYYRDFEGLQVDWELRRRLGKPVSPLAGQQCWRLAYDTLGQQRYADQLWFKWRISLFQYLALVLQPVETALRDWHRQGRLGGTAPGPDEVTMLFSQCLFEALVGKFGLRSGPHYNVHRFLNRFLLLLTGLRRSLLLEQPSRSGGRAE